MLERHLLERPVLERRVLERRVLERRIVKRLFWHGACATRQRKSVQIYSILSVLQEITKTPEIITCCSTILVTRNPKMSLSRDTNT